MKKSFLKLVHYFIPVLIISISWNFAYAQKWAQMNNIPGFDTKRQARLAFSINNKVYVGGGWAGVTLGGRNDFQEFDPATNSWQPKPDLPGATNRTFAISFSINGKGYIGLGAENYFTPNYKILKDLWEYDPSTEKWTKKSDFPDAARYQSTSFVVNNKVYVVGGLIGTNSSSAVAELWEYDPSIDKWTKKSPYPGVDGLANQYAFSINGKGYVCSGEVLLNGQSSMKLTKDTYEYDPSIDKWTKKADYPDDLFAGSAFVIDGKAYCGFGAKSISSASKNFHVYDPVADSWTQLSTVFPGSARYFASVAVIGSKAYIGSGSGGTPGVHYDDWYELNVPVSITKYNNTKSEVDIYPNPAQKTIYIKQPIEAKLISVEILDVTGKKIAAKEIESTGKINIDDIPTGTYHLKLFSNNGTTYYQKIAVNK